MVHNYKYKEVKNCRNYIASGTFTYYFATEFKAKTNFFSPTLLLRTRAITDTKSSPEGVRNNGS